MTLTDNQKRALVKRIADIYEKVGVAGLALGLFQYNFQGALIGLGFLAVKPLTHIPFGAMNMDLWTLVAIFGVIGAAFALYLLRGLPPKHRH